VPKDNHGYRHWKVMKGHYDKELKLLAGRDPEEVEEELRQY
jgi:hypothetical protein